MIRLRPLLRFGLPVLLICGAVLASGCTKEVGGKLGSTLGKLGDSYLGKAGVPGDIGVSDVTEEVGGILGEKIQKYLDESERRQAEVAARESIGSGAVGPKSTRTWKSQTNSDISGGSTVISQTTAPDGRECRSQRNYVNVKGKDVEQTETLCRDPKTGAWSAKTV